MTAGADRFANARLTEDRLLGGRVRLLQPVAGYRAATDPVLLAAAVPARPDQTVLELGTGVGAALLCLAARVPELRLTGLELQPDYLELARRNATANGVEATLVQGDVARPPRTLTALAFNHVMMNPPWHDRASPPAPDPGRDLAHRIETPLSLWLDCALRRLKPRGRLLLIQRIESLPLILSLLTDRAGGIVVKPLSPRPGRPAKRFLLSACKGSRTPFRLESALVLHEGEQHLRDGDDFTPCARAILRDAAPLGLGDGA